MHLNREVLSCRKQYVLNMYFSIYCLNYPACKSNLRLRHTVCDHLWPVWLCHIFRNCLTSWTIFGIDLFDTKCVFWFSILQIICNVSSSRRYCKGIYVFIYSAWYCCATLAKLQFARHILIRAPNIKFHENPLGLSRVVPWRYGDERTDGQTQRS